MSINCEEKLDSFSVTANPSVEHLGRKKVDGVERRSVMDGQNIEKLETRKIKQF